MLNYLQVKQEFDFDMTPPHRSRVTSLQRTKLTRRLLVDGAILFLWFTIYTYTLLKQILIDTFLHAECVIITTLLHSL